MKKFLSVVIFCILVSCSAKKEVTEQPPQPVPPPPKPPLVTPAPPPPLRYRTVFQCDEDTTTVFNRCGLEVLPFLRPVLFDIDGDGALEMIAGAKDGTVRLYKNIGTADGPRWRLVENYFRGIKSGAFSAAAAGDIDGDGNPEIVLGTGGFSSDSGRVMIYRNAGANSSPVWQAVDGISIQVGNDATPALLNTGRDGRPDLVVGNSSGRLFLFRNETRGGRIAFRRDNGFFGNMNLGMYVVPTATSRGGRTIVITGNSMGKLYLLEKDDRGSPWKRSPLPLSCESFAAPAFVREGTSEDEGLVVAEGNGALRYFRNKKKDYRHWEEASGYFGERILAGPACSPSVTSSGDNSYMVVGNINGVLKLFKYEPAATGLPWVEQEGVFSGIKLPGFSRGVLTEWDGRPLLITGEQDGVLRAFLNKGTTEKPSWTEQEGFFGSLPQMLHAAPTVFDIDGDGKWELIVGDTEGYVQAFRDERAGSNPPHWSPVKDMFRYVKVGRFAVPSLSGDGERIYLTVGEQGGKVALFVADKSLSGPLVFRRDDYLEGIRMKKHSAPSAAYSHGGMDLTVGDYDGNLKHFACRKTLVSIKGKQP